MSLTPLLDALSADPVVRKVVETARRGDAPLVDVAVSPGARSPLLAALAGDGATPLLAVTATGREAEDLAEALRCFLPADRVADFPALGDAAARAAQPAQRHRRPPARRAAPAHPPRRERPGVRPARRRRRTRSARCCSRWPRGWASWPRSTLTAGDERPLEDVVEALAAAAYTRTDLVERRGEFAVRGGILDVFPPTEEHPVRVEFWGDTVEEIRWFKVADQRSLEIAEHGLWAPPCRELLLTDAVRERARVARRRSCPAWPTCSAKLAEGIAVEGMESARARPWSTAWSPCSTSCARRARVVLWSTPSASAPARTTSSPRAPSSSRPAGSNAAAGNAVPVDLQGVLGTRVVLDAGRASAAHAARHRPAVVDADLVRRRRRAGRVHRRTTTTSSSASTSAPPTSSRSAATPTRRSRDLRGWVARRLARRRRHRRPRPGPPRASRCSASTTSPGRAGPDGRGSASSRARPRHDRLAGRGFVDAQAAARGRHRDRPDRQPGRARPPRTCAGCRRAGATRSTRSSCGPATTSSTSSTASAGSSR